MTDAPETKWLTLNGGLPTGAPWPKSELVEYTRTDILQARIAELEAELKGWQDQFKAQFPDAIAALKAKP